MFLILLFSRMFVSRLVVNPLHIIENASSALAKGDTQHRPAFTSNDELGSLSKSINVLAESIEEKDCFGCGTGQAPVHLSSENTGSPQV
jgi:HAMP domain-containing protein